MFHVGATHVEGIRAQVHRCEDGAYRIDIQHRVVSDKDIWIPNGPVTLTAKEWRLVKQLIGDIELDQAALEKPPMEEDR